MKQRIVSYNVNGIRSAAKKGLLEFIGKVNPDVMCFQELKARPQDLDESILHPKGYRTYWHSAEKKGYSGVAIWSKEEPEHVEIGCGLEIYDREGRVIRADFKDYSVMNIYLPSGTTGTERQTFKETFLDDFYGYVQDIRARYPKLVICGDFNIAHTEIDIHNPVGNKKSSGFLPHERAWVTKFLESGFVDSFRMFHPEPDQYSWWSFRAASRKRNKGWRIDYHMVTQELATHCRESLIHTDEVHSDHAALELHLEW
ncbi:MAG: exodeoxyribonuclease III [Bacteroidota bacterium]